MVSFLAKKNNGLLGIDISSSSIKLLELSKSGSKYKVECYASRPLPDGSVVEKNIANLDAVGETMLKLASLVDASTDKAAVAVSGSAVITKSIAMNAALTDSEMETQIALEVTPQITPDGRINMLLQINQDSVVPGAGAVPAIATNSVITRVLVNDGDTIVLGGVFR